MAKIPLHLAFDNDELEQYGKKIGSIVENKMLELNKSISIGSDEQSQKCCLVM